MDTLSNIITAAERIAAEQGPEPYYFAPGITVTPPSPRRVRALMDIVQGFGESPDEDQMMEMMSVLVGDEWPQVLEYLEECPVDVYVPLFLDLFENVLRMCPAEIDVESLTAKSEKRWRVLRPDYFPDGK